MLESEFRDESSLSVGKLCQLAILRSKSGQDGQTLASQILPLYPFPSLWSRENEYNQNEAQCSINFLLRAFGKEPVYKDVSVSCLNSLQPLPSFKEDASASPKATLFNFGANIQSAFVNYGEGVALGAMKCGAVEILAFGPQLHPLNNPKLFGVHRTDTQWSAVSAQREVWFEYQCSKNGFEVRFIGITSDTPVFFVFYVKAELSYIDNDIFSPKSLQRYHHHAQKVTFQSHTNRFSIENLMATKMQLIPLAGSGCFWDSDYLLAYEIPIHDQRAIFQF